MKNDVIIIGGGAAGLCAAVALKKKSPRLSVRLLEAMPRVGKKLALTGNGRCNITNRDIKPGRYHGKNPEFCRYALEKYSGHPLGEAIAAKAAEDKLFKVGCVSHLAFNRPF